MNSPVLIGSFLNVCICLERQMKAGETHPVRIRNFAMKLPVAVTSIGMAWLLNAFLYYDFPADELSASRCD
ncbi:MAG: hypothetical protein U9R74_04515 [Pseudomonadota bacterium]|nr:hypothetical protein [Pseudomonadota bacterium]